MTFQDLQNTLKTINDGSNFKFDLSWINSKLTEQLDDFVKIIDNVINLFNSKYELIDTNTISLTGEIHVKGSTTYFEIRMAFFNTPTLDYLITIEPNGKWENEVDGTIRTILQALPVDFKETMFLHSSMDLEKATIVFDENKIYELGITKGVGIVTHIKSDLLQKLNLPDSLFQIIRTPEGIYEVVKELNLESKIASVFEILVKKIKFLNKQSIEVAGVLSLPFPGDKIDIPASFAVSQDLYQATIKVDKNIKLTLPYFLAGDGVYVGNIEVDLQGSFIQPDYNYGLFADFAIGQQVKPRSTSANRNELNDGEVRVIYNSTSQATLVPVFIEAFAKEITLSKIVQLFAGKIVKLPEFLNQIVKFYSTYFYYCSPDQSRVLVNGVEAKKGIALSSGVQILGLDAYCDFSSIEKETKGNIILEPINIANLVKIEGDGIGSPSGYNGPVIEKGGVQLYFDSKGTEQNFRTDVSVTLFDTYKFKAGGKVQDEGLQFYYDLELGFVKAQLNCQLKTIDDFKLTSKFDTKLLGLKADLGILGKLSLDLSTNCEILFAIKSQTSDGKASLLVGFNLNGTAQKISLSFNIKDISSIEEVIRKAVIDLIISLLKSAEEWLKAILNNLVKLADDAIKEAELIAESLVQAFGQTIESSTKLLKKIGWNVEKAALILNHGYKQVSSKAAKLLSEAGYEAGQVADALINVYKETATNVCKILSSLYEADKIGKALAKYTTEIVKNLPELHEIYGEKVGALLNGLGKTTKESGQILKDVLKLSDDAIRKILTIGKFPKPEITIHFPDRLPEVRIPRCVVIMGRRVCR